MTKQDQETAANNGSKVKTVAEIVVASDLIDKIAFKNESTKNGASQSQAENEHEHKHISATGINRINITDNISAKKESENDGVTQKSTTVGTPKEAENVVTKAQIENEEFSVNLMPNEWRLAVTNGGRGIPFNCTPSSSLANCSPLAQVNVIIPYRWVIS